MAKESSVPPQLSVSYISNTAKRAVPLFADWSLLLLEVVEEGGFVVVDVGFVVVVVEGVVVLVPLSGDAECVDDDEAESLSFSTQSHQSSQHSRVRRTLPVCIIILMASAAAQYAPYNRRDHDDHKYPQTDDKPPPSRFPFWVGCITDYEWWACFCGPLRLAIFINEIFIVVPWRAWQER
jgi:hypothetical protein